MVQRTRDAIMVGPVKHATVDEPVDVLVEPADNVNMDDPLNKVGEKRIWTRANWTYDFGVDEDHITPKLHREHFKQVENVVDRIQNKGGPINPLSAQKENKRSLMVRRARVIILHAPASQETTVYASP